MSSPASEGSAAESNENRVAASDDRSAVDGDSSSTALAAAVDEAESDDDGVEVVDISDNGSGDLIDEATEIPDEESSVVTAEDALILAAGSSAMSDQPAHAIAEASNVVSNVAASSNELAPPPYSTIPVGDRPWGLAAGGDSLYVTGRSGLSVIDTATNTQTGAIPVSVSRGDALTVTPDGATAAIYAAGGILGWRSSTISIIDVANEKVANTVRLDGWGRGIAVSADGTKVYVATDRFWASSKLTVIETATGKILTETFFKGNPTTVLIDPVDGNKVYVGQRDLFWMNSSVLKIDTVEKRVLDDYTTSGVPESLAISSDSKTLYTGVNSVDQVVRAINTENKKYSVLSVGTSGPRAYPIDVAMSPDGKTVLVTTSNVWYGNPIGLTVINTAPSSLDGAPIMTLAATIKTGSSPSTVTFGSDGLTAYVATTEGGASVVSAVKVNAFNASGSSEVAAAPVAVAFKPTSDRAYVVNQAARSVSVINATNNEVIDTITKDIGRNPSAIAVSPDGSMAYVSFGGGPLESSGVSVINTQLNRVVDTLVVGANPTSLAVTPDGTTLYVTYSGGTFSSAGVSKIELGSKVNRKVASADKPSGVAISPDGLWAYVTNEGSNTVTIINTQTEFQRSVRVGSSPMALAFTPSGDKVIVVNRGTNPIARPSISIIDTDTLKIHTEDEKIGTPSKMALSPNGELAYITDAAGTVTVIDVSSSDRPFIRASIKTGGAPAGVAFSPNGGTVYVTNRDSNSFWIFGGLPSPDFTRNVLITGV